MTLKNLRIGLDIDDTLATFFDTYKEYFNTKKYPSRLKEHNITKNVVRILKFDRDFWLNLPVKNRITFVPELYCTSRVCNKAWTKEWLNRNMFPRRPVYQVFGHGMDKSRYIKGKVDIFVDDSLTNFIALNLSGIPCLLLDNGRNDWWEHDGRIFSLDKNEILEEYFRFKHRVLPHFEELV